MQANKSTKINTKQQEKKIILFLLKKEKIPYKTQKVKIQIFKKKQKTLKHA